MLLLPFTLALHSQRCRACTAIGLTLQPSELHTGCKRLSKQPQQQLTLHGESLHRQGWTDSKGDETLQTCILTPANSCTRYALKYVQERLPTSSLDH